MRHWLPLRPGAARSAVPAPVLGLALATVLAFTGCATALDNRPHNVPSTAEFSRFSQELRSLPGENVIGLSLSGGGMRAAAFAFGVMQALTAAGDTHTDVFDDVAFISSVSGGSLTAAYMTLKGRAGMDSFRDVVLRRNLELNLRVSMFLPTNLLRLMAGGVNDRSNLGHTLDTEIFKGATFADVYARRHPDLWINATDLYNRVPFPFIPPLFQGLCSDLSQLKVSEAVAASMAVPLAFAPVVLQTFPEKCTDNVAPWIEAGLVDAGSVTNSIVSAAARAVRNYRDPERMRYVKLADGGLSDNQGLASLLIVRAIAGTPYGPLAEGDAIRMRRMLFLIVDAGRPPVGDWGLQLDGPSGLDVAIAAADSAIDSATRLSAASFRVMVEAWREDVVKHRCALTPAQVGQHVRDMKNWRCDDLVFHVGTLSAESLDAERARRLRNMPTRLALPDADLDAAIAGGRDAALGSAALRDYVAESVKRR